MDFIVLQLHDITVSFFYIKAVVVLVITHTAVKCWLVVAVL